MIIRWWAFLLATGLTAAVCGSYGFILGRSIQTTTYESDLAACTNACEHNGGLDRIRTNVSCTCENGAYFQGDDVR